jgi:hypothetical protein
MIRDCTPRRAAARVAPEPRGTTFRGASDNVVANPGDILSRTMSPMSVLPSEGLPLRS